MVSLFVSRTAPELILSHAFKVINLLSESAVYQPTVCMRNTFLEKRRKKKSAVAMIEFLKADVRGHL